MVVSREAGGLDLPEGVVGCGGIEEGVRRLRERFLGPAVGGSDGENGGEEERRQRGGDGEAAWLGRVFVIGGAEIYRLALEMECCERILWTRLRGEWECDVFFPRGFLPGEGAGGEAEGEHKGKWVRRSTEEMERWVGEEGVGGVKREGEVEFEVCMLERERV